MRLGCLPYLNVRPLVHTLEQGGLPDGWELVYAPPSVLARMLAREEIAAAPVSSFACFADPTLEICPGICIAADGPVKSVLLLSKVPLEQISRVALDTSSLSGANMIRIILAEAYGLTPEYVHSDPPSVCSSVSGDPAQRREHPELVEGRSRRDQPTAVAGMLDSADAALVIGDPAMLCDKDGLYVLDLALEWKKLTGLPAVFAVWAGRGITHELISVLAEAKRQGLSMLPEIARKESSRLGLSYETCFDYLSNTIVYDLGEREQRGLEVFKQKAIAHGLVGQGVADPLVLSSEERAYRRTVVGPSGVAYSRGNRIDGSQALELLESASLPELAWAADRVCAAKHPEPVKTYVIDRNINYTNICTSGCGFCAFYRSPDDPEGYVRTNHQIFDKIAEAVDLGATQILMQGGLHPDLRIDYFETLLTETKSRFQVQVHCLSAPEVVHIARISGLAPMECLRRLREAGLDSLPGGGAEILVDSVRSRVSPHKCTADQWLDVMRAASELDMRATATMLFGMSETLADRVEHLDRIRSLQDETGVFTAFIPWTFQPGNTALGGSAAGGHDYLRTLAVSRIYLDNIDNIQASWVTQGEAIAQLALRFGANDIGSTMIEENVVAAAGVSHRMGEAALIGLIHRAGFDAAQRTTLYETIVVHPQEHPEPVEGRSGGEPRA